MQKAYSHQLPLPSLDFSLPNSGAEALLPRQSPRLILFIRINYRLSVKMSIAHLNTRPTSMSVFKRFWKFLSRESQQNDDQKKAAQAYGTYVHSANGLLKAEQKIARDLRKDQKSD
jgi:hypothetical protein